jgi:hypothetical protein
MIFDRSFDLDAVDAAFRVDLVDRHHDATLHHRGVSIALVGQAEQRADTKHRRGLRRFGGAGTASQQCWSECEHRRGGAAR